MFHDDCANEGRKAIGDGRWSAENAPGGALDRSAALALAVAQPPSRAAPQRADSPLTRRQPEVARLARTE